MKTTVDIADGLFARAKKHAKRTGRPLRALIEDGLRRVLETESAERTRFRLIDRSVGKAGAKNPLENWSWQDLRDEIYGGR
jgi:hypothetical protein